MYNSDTENKYQTQQDCQWGDKIIKEYNSGTPRQKELLMKRLRGKADSEVATSITDEEMDFVKIMQKAQGQGFGEFNGLATGYKCLDEYLLGLKPGDVVVVGAYTNLGKSSITMDWCFNMCQAGSNVLLFVLEDNEGESGSRGTGLLKARGLEPEGIYKWPGKFHHFPISKRSAFFRNKFAILPAIKALALTRNVEVICVDMLNDIVDPINDKDADDFMVALKDMCDDLGVVTIVTARLREPKGITAKAQLRERYAPDEDGIYGRGMIKYLATKIITIAESASHEFEPQVAFSGYETQYLALNVCKNRTGNNTKREGKVITLKFMKGKSLGMKYEEVGVEDLDV